MALTLTSAITETRVVDGIKVTNIEIDFTDQELYITYDELSGTTVLGEKTVLIDEAGYLATMADINTLVGTSINTGFRQGLYNRVMAATGMTGTTT